MEIINGSTSAGQGRGGRALLEATLGQRFILFGDSNHVDYRVYSRIIEAYPDRVAAALIHHVRDFDESTLAPGVVVYDDYAHAAALLLSRSLIDEETARRVMIAAQEQGLEITDAEIEQLWTSPHRRLSTVRASPHTRAIGAATSSAGSRGATVTRSSRTALWSVVDGDVLSRRS